MWVRGLKPICRIGQTIEIIVAPYVGAWIETDLYCMTAKTRYVAPYVGAWIETKMLYDVALDFTVAPYVGAWIET